MKLKTERVAELKKAVERYLARGESNIPVIEQISEIATVGPDADYESDHNDDSA
jgi:hypothetical protein